MLVLYGIIDHVGWSILNDFYLLTESIPGLDRSKGEWSEEGKTTYLKEGGISISLV